MESLEQKIKTIFNDPTQSLGEAVAKFEQHIQDLQEQAKGWENDRSSIVNVNTGLRQRKQVIDAYQMSSQEEDEFESACQLLHNWLHRFETNPLVLARRIDNLWMWLEIRILKFFSLFTRSR